MLTVHAVAHADLLVICIYSYVSEKFFNTGMHMHLHKH